MPTICPTCARPIEKRLAVYCSPDCMDVAREKDAINKEIAGLTKKIQAAHASMMFGPTCEMPLCSAMRESGSVYCADHLAKAAIENRPEQKPKGLDSGIAIGMALDAEVQREIQKWVDDAEPGKLFGLDRSQYPARLSQESYRGPRQPAWPDLRQRTALPGICYRIYTDVMRDAVLLVATDTDGSGRMMHIGGELYVRARRRTNAPLGEVDMTDDDHETALGGVPSMVCTFESPGADDSPTGATDLELMLFKTDPEVIAHVTQQLDLMTPNLAGDRLRKLEDGLCTAHCRACRNHEPERTWLDRATSRMRAIEDRRGE